jgi:outer membrane lipoprotein carrier protein
MNIRTMMMLGVSASLVAGGCRGAETGEPATAEGVRQQVEAPSARGDLTPPLEDGAQPGVGTGEATELAAAPGPSAGAGEVRPTVGAGATTAAASGGASASPAPAPVTATTPDAATVLRRAEQVYDGVRSMEADFVQNVDVPLLGQSTRSQGKLYHRSPDRFLMQFSQPQGDIVVADGRHLWMYYPSVDARQVMRTTMAAAGGQVDLHREFLSNPTERYHAVLAGRETVGGRATDVVVLTPRARSGYRQVRIWVDREDALVRRFEITEENESVRTLELRNIRRNPTLGDQLFQFTPPAGAQVFDQ